MTPINRRRLAVFRSSKRGVYSLVVFGLLFFLSLFAELLANDKPILIYYDGGFYSPLIRDYPETTFGGVTSTSTCCVTRGQRRSIENSEWSEARTSSVAFPSGTGTLAPRVGARVVWCTPLPKMPRRGNS